ncbi:MAG: HDOD domain-containing protein [Opitutae bacterium]|nr:HDOD domain-containing protein [Opitutae bacterium]
MLFSTPEGMIAQIKALPSAPHAMQRMLALLEDPNSSTEDLIELIRLERSLTARVVHMANSPVFGAGSCGSVEEAVQRLGYRVVHEAVLAAMAVASFSSALRTYRLPANTLWRQALATACAAREIARRTDGAPDAAYTLGLLHNIGMVAIDRWVQQRDPTVQLLCAPWPDEWRTAETGLLGFDHADTTAAMLKAWKFPTELVEAARYQFRPGAARAARRPAACLRTAHWIRRMVCSEDLKGQLPDPEVLALAGVESTGLVDVAQQVLHEVETLWESLQLDHTQAA